MQPAPTLLTRVGADRTLAARIGCAIGIGLALRYVCGPEPVWWLAWAAPTALLILAFSTPRAVAAAGLVAVAALIGVSSNLAYYLVVMPAPVALSATLARAALWLWVVVGARRIVLRYRSWWVVFAYPTLWVAADTLMTALLPDGNWGSLAYSQSEFLPILQLASLSGVAGVLFVLALVHSALALGLTRGPRLRHASWAYLSTVAILGASLVYGHLRLQTPPSGSPVVIGLVAIDDSIGPQATAAYAQRIWSGYERQVAGLAARGAQVVLLPEKIAVLAPAQANQAQQWLGALAAKHRIWLDAGVALANGKGRLNLSWRFSPVGELVQAYQKHHLAPVEPDFDSGTQFNVSMIDGARYGMAICKDMHFDAFGREYARRAVSVMLVPAWDFGVDAWMGSRMTLTRGVEAGYTVVRSAREGLLTISDPYGRVIAETASGAVPGAALLARVPVGAPVPTLYAKIGNLFGWLCVGASIVLLSIGRKADHRHSREGGNPC